MYIYIYRYIQFNCYNWIQLRLLPWQVLIKFHINYPKARNLSCHRQGRAD